MFAEHDYAEGNLSQWEEDGWIWKFN